MRSSTIVHKLIGIEAATVTSIDFENDAQGPLVVVSVAVHQRAGSRCPQCGVRGPGYDRTGHVRRWRHLDMGSMRCYIAAAAPRVTCSEHGVVTAAVPWARHPGAKCTRAVEDTAAWLSAHAAVSTVMVYLRLSFRTIVSMIERVVAEQCGATDRLAGLRRIGVDEIAYRKGHRYLTVIVDHDTGRLVWAREGRSKATLEEFFDELGPARSGELTHVSADAAEWISTVVSDRAPHAVRCMDPFHVIMWATRAIDKVRRRVLARMTGLTALDRRQLRWAMLKNPENLTAAQRGVLRSLAEESNTTLMEAYALKEQLRQVYSPTTLNPVTALAQWIAVAGASRIPEIVALGRSVNNHREPIVNAIDHRLSNARVEATNTHLRALTKRSYGFGSPEALIAMATLTRGGACPTLPNRK